MPGSLVDTNVWIAALLPTHPFHGQARRVVLEATPAAPLIFCRATQQSFLRLVTTPALLRVYGAEDLNDLDAWAAFDAFLGMAQVCLREEPPGLEPLWRRMASRDTALPKVWMDTYLAAFAVCGAVSLVTTDRDFTAYAGYGLRVTLLNP